MYAKSEIKFNVIHIKFASILIDAIGVGRHLGDLHKDRAMVVLKILIIEEQ